MWRALWGTSGQERAEGQAVWMAGGRRSKSRRKQEGGEVARRTYTWLSSLAGSRSLRRPNRRLKRGLQNTLRRPHACPQDIPERHNVLMSLGPPPSPPSPHPSATVGTQQRGLRGALFVHGGPHSSNSGPGPRVARTGAGVPADYPHPRNPGIRCHLAGAGPPKLRPFSFGATYSFRVALRRPRGP